MDKEPFTDSHAHLSYVLERQGRDIFSQIVDAYGQCGSALILDPGVDPDDFPARKELFKAYPFIKLAAGIWPDGRWMKSPEKALAMLEASARDPQCLAIGECGLDYHWMNGSEEEQEKLFRLQAELAVSLRKPLIVHSRDAFEPTLKIVSDYSEQIPVLIHCFGYDADAADAFIKTGCWVSFAGNLTYRKADALREAIKRAPMERLLLETDSPYMNPEPGRGRPSSPLDIERTYRVAAREIGVTVDELRLIVRKNLGVFLGTEA